jgi:hypothetical protein
MRRYVDETRNSHGGESVSRKAAESRQPIGKIITAHDPAPLPRGRAPPRLTVAQHPLVATPPGGNACPTLAGDPSVPAERGSRPHAESGAAISALRFAKWNGSRPFEKTEGRMAAYGKRTPLLVDNVL